MIAKRKDHRCPLCGGPNRCGEPDPAKPKGGCWCFHRYFPPELLARVPAQRRRSPCICPDCLAAFLADAPEQEGNGPHAPGNPSSPPAPPNPGGRPTQVTTNR